MTSILGKRKYQTAMGYINDYPSMQPSDSFVPNYHDIPEIPKFSKELFETADGLQQLLLWFEEYNKALLRHQLVAELEQTDHEETSEFS